MIIYFSVTSSLIIEAQNSIAIGSSGNAYTIIDTEANMVVVDDDLDVVVFIHRGGNPTEPKHGGESVSQYRFDVSYDRGLTWTIDEGALNPSAPQANIPNGHHRYPEVALYNPSGNTDPNKMYLVYLGATHDGGAVGSVWDGTSHGVGRLDLMSSTYTENSTIQNGKEVNIPSGFCQGKAGTYWAVDFENDGTESKDIIIYKATFNTTTSDLDLTLDQKITPPHDRSFDGTSTATGINIAFDKTGQYGWIVFLGDIFDDGVFVYQPVFYKTIDGGVTWNGPESFDLKGFDNIRMSLPDSGDFFEATAAFETDIVVDKNGDPHLFVNTGIGDPANPFNIVAAGQPLFDITYSSAISSWCAIYIDTIENLRETITAALNQDSRPQVTTNPAGDKIFFLWVDTDGFSPRNLVGKAYDINTGKLTPTTDFTKGDPVWDGLALFHSAPVNCFVNSDTNHIPVIITEIPIDEMNPVYFHYLKNVYFLDGKFTEDENKYCFVPSCSPPLFITMSKVDATCGNFDGSASVVATGGISPYSYIWSSGGTGSTESGLGEGNYSVTVTDNNSCFVIGNVTINLDTVIVTQDICLVTVDSNSAKNDIIWEKPVVTGIDSFRIYRYIGSNYEHIGSVSYNSLSVFSDNYAGVNPKVTSHRYKLSVLDICSSEGSLSNHHETMHLSVSAGTPPAMDLVWDAYEGFSFDDYRILRDTTGNGNFELIGSISSTSFTSYTDLTPPQKDVVSYVIEVMHPAGCETTAKVDSFISSRSNTADKVVGIDEIGFDVNSITIYPNPNDGSLTIEAQITRNTDLAISLNNILGEKVIEINEENRSGLFRKEIDITTLASGIYLVRIQVGKTSIARKFIKE